MASGLLETKLHIPTPRRAIVARPRLAERLSRIRRSTLTIVSAPAGFGKTTVLTDWLTANRGSISAAWLSLDARDGDPTTYWTYVIAALRTAADGVGEGALALLQSGQSPIEVVLGALVNDLQAVSGEVVLVLDDYHVIEAQAVHQGMTFFLERLPPHVHIVIASRADPALPLARLRARGELLEVRAAELRFTTDEAAAYLNGAMGLTLTAEDVALLEARTEGWIAALQLAALSMQDRTDSGAFIASFAGDDRFIVDYLVEEVLQRQPAEIRKFLLQTSILGRLSGPLCDAVTGQNGGRARLEALDRANLFVVPLDDRRQWYRYHHLFADVLRARLLDEQPQLLVELHKRASEWYERNDELPAAVRHALESTDVNRAATLVERGIKALSAERKDATLQLWLESVPEEVLRVRPVINVAYAGVLMSTGRTVNVEARLRDVERCLNGETPDMVVVDHEAFAGLPAAIAMYRAAQALLSGDLAGTKTHALRALEVVADDDHMNRGGPAALLGLAYWTAGDLADARRWYAEGLASIEKAGYLPDVAGCAIAVADICLAQGRLRDAKNTYEHALSLVTRDAGPSLRGAADMHVGLAGLAYERDDLGEARRHLSASAELGEFGGLRQNRYRSRVAMARLRCAEGDLDGAVGLLDEAQRVYIGDFSPDVRPVAASRARMLIAQGRLVKARAWAHDRGLAVDDELSYVRHYEHLIFARLLLAEGAAADGVRLLERLRGAADGTGHDGGLLEILVVLAVAQHASGARSAALSTVERAVAIGQSEGYVRIFFDEGAAMQSLLQSLTAGRGGSSYADVLLGANAGANAPRSGATAAFGATLATLVDPLSARELDILRLLASDLGGPEIARHLVVSLNTVRTHTKNIYAKLGVTSRREAVTRGRDLRLL